MKNQWLRRFFAIFALGFRAIPFQFRPKSGFFLHAAEEVSDPAQIALSAIGQNIRPVTQSAARLYDDCVFFDEDDGVALGKEPGTLMARALGDRSAMVLKCHGLLTAGRSIPEAILLANTMEENAEIQLMAMAASGNRLELPSPEGAKRSKEYLRSERAISRSWATWMRQLERQRPDVLRMM